MSAFLWPLKFAVIIKGIIKYFNSNIHAIIKLFINAIMGIFEKNEKEKNIQA